MEQANPSPTSRTQGTFQLLKFTAKTYLHYDFATNYIAILYPGWSHGIIFKLSLVASTMMSSGQIFFGCIIHSQFTPMVTYGIGYHLVGTVVVLIFLKIFVAPLITPILDFVRPFPWVSKPGLFSHLHSCLLVCSEPKGHIWCYTCLFHQYGCTLYKCVHSRPTFWTSLM